MDLSVNTIKSWIRKSRLKNVSKESTDNQINDEIKLIEGNSKTKNRAKMERLRSVKIEIVNKHTDSWDAFYKILSKNRNIIGKQYIVAVERDNSNVRNDFARFLLVVPKLSLSPKGWLIIPLSFGKLFSFPIFFLLFSKLSYLLFYKIFIF